MGRFVKGVSDGLSELTHTAHESEGILKEILNGEMFIVWKEKAEVAIEAVKIAFEALEGAFDGTVVKAEEFAISNAKFAATIGVTTEQAAGLSAALRGVGLSSDDYARMTLKLEMGLRSNEERMKQLGIETRDASGHLLSGKELMDSAVKTFQSYKSGTDANSFALEIFGRKAQDLYDVMRVSDDQVEHQTEIYKQFGVQLDGNVNDATRLEDGIADLKTMFEALSISLGQQLMPIAQEVIEWLGGDGKDILIDLAKQFEGLIEDTLTFARGILSVASALKEMGSTASEALKASATGELPLPGMAGQAKVAIVDVSKAAKEQTGIVADLTKAFDGLDEAIKRAQERSGKKPFQMFPDIAEGTPESIKKPGIFDGGSKSYTAKDKGGGNKVEDEEIKSEEKIALEKIAIESSANSHMLAMGAETTEAFVEQQRQLENDTYAVKSESITKQLALSGNTKAQIAKLLDEQKQDFETHVGNLVKIAEDGEARKKALADKARADAMRDDEETLRDGIADIQTSAEMGKISMLDKVDAERKLTIEIRNQEMQRLDDQLATLSPESDAYEAVVKQKQRLEKQFTNDLKGENRERIKDMQALVTEWTGPLTTGFNTAINDMVLSGKKFSDAMADMGKSILSSLVTTFEKIAEDWAVKQISMALLAKTEAASSAGAQIEGNIGVAATGAAASQAAVPFIGPALAVAAAGAMVASLAVFEGMAHASGGMLLDRDQLVFAHKGEQVLPANISSGLQTMISQGGSGGGGDTHLHYSPTINGGNQGMEQLLRTDGQALKAWMAEQSRLGAFKSR